MSPRKTTKKKTTRKQTPRKAAPPKASRPKAAKKAATPPKAAKKAVPPKAVGAAKKAVSATSARKPQDAPRPVPKGKPIPVSEAPHPKYGLKFECFSCGTRFYQMGKPDPVCPKCGTDQRERPKDPPKEPPKPKRTPARPMAPLLEEEEDVGPEDIEVREPGEPDAMFDDAEFESATDEDPELRSVVTTIEDD